ncbi:MAG: DNA primase, partial [Nitrosomonas sp.]|nr:DNA primase [Nitrosomonas sp.]
IIKLDRSLLVECSGNNEEVAALKALVDFLDAHPHLAESKSSSSILTYLQDSPYRALLESIESETLKWGDALDLEAEFLGALGILQQVQRKKRMTELRSKSLDQLTDEEKRELQRLAMLMKSITGCQ